VPIPEHLQPQYRDLLHVVGTMNAGLLAGDLEGTILWANPPLLRWLGYSYEEILGKSAVDLGVAEHAEALRAEIAAIAGGDLRPRLMVMRRSDRSDRLSVGDRHAAPRHEPAADVSVAAGAAAVR